MIIWWIEDVTEILSQKGRNHMPNQKTGKADKKKPQKTAKEKKAAKQEKKKNK
jgi:hypothetical protein